MSAFEDLAGNTFSQLTVIERDMMPSVKPKWICKCSCGNFTSVLSYNLKAKRTISCGCSKALPKGKSAFNSVFKSYIHGAEKRNLEWSLDEKAFREITREDCHYCGSAPSNIATPKSGNGSFIYNGLDRVDNSVGYLKNNIVACCKVCNFAKSGRDFDEFKNWIMKAANHLAKED